jgi:hypothetical protein
VQYVSNVINVAKKLQNSLAGGTNNTTAIVADAERLVQCVAELSDYFQLDNLGKKARKVFMEIKFGPVSDYKMPLNLNGAELFVYILVPILGWTFYFIARAKLKKCRSDVDELIGRLETFKHLLKNPEMEHML